MKTPEHDKLMKVKDKSQAIGEFLDWMQNEHHIHLSVYDDNYYQGQLLMPLPYNWQRLIAEFFEIDPDGLEAEKVALLEEVRASTKKLTEQYADTLEDLKDR